MRVWSHLTIVPEATPGRASFRISGVSGPARLTTGVRRMVSSMFRSKKKIVMASALACLAALASLPFVLTGEYSRVTSPDGRFYALATYPIWQSFVPMAPGSSGDRSGSITVYTAGGSFCGRAPVDMVRFIQDLEWTTNHAEIRLVADWDLSKRRVQRFR